MRTDRAGFSGHKHRPGIETGMRASLAFTSRQVLVLLTKCRKSLNDLEDFSIRLSDHSKQMANILLFMTCVCTAAGGTSPFTLTGRLGGGAQPH